MKTQLNLLTLLLLILLSAPAFGAEKVIISYSSRSYAFLPAQIAVVKGFFKDENLEPLLIQMRSQVTVPKKGANHDHGTFIFFVTKTFGARQ